MLGMQQLVRDTTLAHQIVIQLYKTHLLSVSCNCIVRSHGLPLMTHANLDAAMAQIAYAEHLSSVTPTEKDHDG
jgi:hypothetical protein